MIFRAITGINDWQFGKGVNTYLTGNDAIAANIRTKLLFFMNDCFFALDTGIDWWNLLGGKNPTAQANILLQTRQTLVQCEGVVRINSVQVSVANRKATISYNVDTIYSRNVTGFVTT